ncbi:hypothetical protein CMQ_612 [Grosmannia clavigera kw1407]|uniref:Uncharacterized protein n=1 Tax=Grosmannia clavigera (strain kw1407 / UAMH 11150) TaxID=655863 RepID=F0XD95_GROCL|nr:uncharacterized protein CMQ_612 [Grosmannia clavigera kw1407]EFX03684.1 hypothetical protein CMQ_612 [Grosmannia clavigera kw1407]
MDKRNLFSGRRGRGRWQLSSALSDRPISAGRHQLADAQASASGPSAYTSAGTSRPTNWDFRRNFSKVSEPARFVRACQPVRRKSPVRKFVAERQTLESVLHTPSPSFPFASLASLHRNERPKRLATGKRAGQERHRYTDDEE